MQGRSIMGRRPTCDEVESQTVSWTSTLEEKDKESWDVARI
jgi:hypothetical protein